MNWDSYLAHKRKKNSAASQLLAFVHGRDKKAKRIWGDDDSDDDDSSGVPKNGSGSPKMDLGCQKADSVEQVQSLY